MGLDEPVAGISCLVFFITSIILFACSFDVLDPRFHGLVFDDTFKTVPRNEIRRDERSDSGRFLIGLGRSVVPYPGGLVLMEWMKGGVDGDHMNCWSKDGQSVYLDVSLQLEVKKDKLPLLYYRYGTYWRNPIRLMVLRVIKEQASLFETLEYFEKRAQITTSMRSALEAKFGEDGNFFAVWDFQLRQIELPDDFEASIINKILKKQERQKARNTQQVEIKKAEKERELALADADAALVRTIAAQEGLITVAKEEADGHALLVKSYATLYRQFADRMGWFKDENVDSLGFPALHYYIYSRLGKDHKATHTQEIMGFGAGYERETEPRNEL